MKIILSSALFLLGAALAAIPTGPSAVLFENSEVKVLRALENNHELGKFHRHDANRVMVYLQSARQRFEYQDGRKPEVFDWKAGQVKWSLADGMHAGQVLDHDFNIIEIELKTPGTDKTITGALDPLKVDPAHFTLEFENPQVRVLRVRIKPKGVVPMHAYSTDRVTVFLTDQEFRVKDSTGKVETVEHKAGDAVWETPTTQTDQNLSDKPFEAVTVEVKK
jgi:quercetin dioxygenase-like cupin family protein